MRVPIKPLTILFGANSIGKSTIVQAIHYAREIIERNNLDVDRTIAGGSAVDLGGFQNLVHNHDLNNQITLRFDLDLSETDLPTYRYYLLEEAPFDWSSWAQTAWIELVIQWSHTLKRPVLISYQTALNGVPVGKIETSLDKANILVAYNINHYVFARDEFMTDEEAEQLPAPSVDEAITRRIAQVGFDVDTVTWVNVTLENQTGSLPSWGDLIVVNEESSLEEYGTPHFSAILSQLLVGPGELLRNLLRRFRYLGPLRRTLPRSHRRTLTPDESLWADGTAAWDVLASASDDYVGYVNTWLAYQDKLNTGFSVRLNKFKRIPTDSPLLTELFVALRSGRFFEDYDLGSFEKERDKYEVEMQLVIVDEARQLEVQPHDIGVGISQVIPVVVAALDAERAILAVEQPELHLHPAVQAALGDLFIECAMCGRDNVATIVETHSEHLILRVLRRIRETTANKNEATLSIDPDDLSLLFVGNRQTGTSMQPLRVDKRGRIIDRIPGGFFEEGFAELF